MCIFYCIQYIAQLLNNVFKCLILGILSKEKMEYRTICIWNGFIHPRKVESCMFIMCLKNIYIFKNMKLSEFYNKNSPGPLQPSPHPPPPPIPPYCHLHPTLNILTELFCFDFPVTFTKDLLTKNMAIYRMHNA